MHGYCPPFPSSEAPANSWRTGFALPVGIFHSGPTSGDVSEYVFTEVSPPQRGVVLRLLSIRTSLDRERVKNVKKKKITSFPVHPLLIRCCSGSACRGLRCPLYPLFFRCSHFAAYFRVSIPTRLTKKEQKFCRSFFISLTAVIVQRRARRLRSHLSPSSHDGVRRGIGSDHLDAIFPLVLLAEEKCSSAPIPSPDRLEE
ncbi:hypothetical protein Cni_G03999 [Canna indica]|uniref:Uncharacterized protein n=1 Tax=Canna indica TaxID=4628 RepID=A0AAQ3JSN5_9LILI|nr:hypothetical protein Cni_G03999 [Canna indica]